MIQPIADNAYRRQASAVGYSSLTILALAMITFGRKLGVGLELNEAQARVILHGSNIADFVPQ